MQDRITIVNQGVEPVSFQLALEIGSDFADIFTVKSYDFSFGDPLNAPPLPPLAEPTFDAEADQFLLADPASSAATQVILSEPPALVEGAWASYAIELEPRERWELVVDVVPSPSGETVHPQDGRAALRRGAPARAGLAHRLAAARAPAARGLGRPRAFGGAVDLGPRGAAHPLEGERARPRRAAARRRHAVVHDGVRPRLDRHGLPDAPAGAGARAERPRGARRAPGDRGRSGHRRRAGEDRPRGAAGQSLRVVVRALLRHGRRDAALSRAAVRGVAVDRRHAPRDSSARAGHARARVDRPLRRPRRRRLRRVREALGARPRQPVVEGLARLAAVRGRQGGGRRRSRRARCRATSSTRSSGWPRSRARCGATASSATVSTGRRRSCDGRSTRRTGWTSEAGTTRSRSTATSGPSTPCARTWATCCGAASFPPSAPTPSSTA